MLARRVGVSLPVLRACRRLAPPQLAQPAPLRAASCFRALSTQSGASQSSDAEQPSGGANGGAAGGAEAADKAEEAATPAAEGGADATDAGAGGEAVDLNLVAADESRQLLHALGVVVLFEVDGGFLQRFPAGVMRI